MFNAVSFNLKVYTNTGYEYFIISVNNIHQLKKQIDKVIRTNNKMLLSIVYKNLGFSTELFSRKTTLTVNFNELQLEQLEQLNTNNIQSLYHIKEIEICF